MKRIDYLLTQTRPESMAKSRFTNVIMENITMKNTSQFSWKHFMKQHWIAAGSVAVFAVLLTSFSGYAYATGSDPVTMMKRIIEGDLIKVMTANRTFKHGKKLSYSDAAVNAFAERKLVEELHFKASNAFMVPKNGVEYVSNPAVREYAHPWVGVVTQLDTNEVRIQKHYVLGDKMTPSKDLQEEIVLPLAHIGYYAQGEPKAMEAISSGKPIIVYNDNYLRHRTGSGNEVAPHTQHFIFQLKSDIAAIKESDQTTAKGHGATTASGEQEGIFEPSWGGLSTICLNNGADACSQKASAQKGQSLYGLFTDFEGKKSPQSNPAVIRFGEADVDGSNSSNLITRGVEGAITDVNDSHITLKSSSGAQWKLAYTKEQRNTFKTTWGSELKIGDKISGSIIESVHNLDNRSIENQHIYYLER